MAENSHVWTVPVSAETLALNTDEAKALVVGSAFARRMAETDPEHRARMCEHGRLVFQVCSLCERGVPALADLTLAEQREHARACLG